MTHAIGKLTAAGLDDTADIARAAGVSRRTVQRWIQGHSTPHRDKEARLLELASVIEQAADRLPGGSSAAVAWLREPSPRLGWQVPLDVIKVGCFRQAISVLPAAQRRDDLLHLRDSLIRKVLLRARADLHLPGDQELGEETALASGQTMTFLNAAAALTMPELEDASKASEQVAVLRESGALFAYAAGPGNWGTGILAALSDAWGRNASQWPQAVPLSQVRVILSTSGIATIPLPPPQDETGREAAAGLGQSRPPAVSTHLVLTAASETITANSDQRGSRIDAAAILGACPPRPDLEPTLSVQLAAAAARLVLTAVPGRDRPACEASVAAATHWCQQRNQETAAAAGIAAEGAWIIDGGPAAAAARDTALSAHYHGMADAAHVLEEATESHPDVASSPAGRLSGLAFGFTVTAAQNAARAAAEPATFLASLATTYHQLT